MTRRHLSYYILGAAIIFFLGCVYISHKRESDWLKEIQRKQQEETRHYEQLAEEKRQQEIERKKIDERLAKEFEGQRKYQSQLKQVFAFADYPAKVTKLPNVALKENSIVSFSREPQGNWEDWNEIFKDWKNEEYSFAGHYKFIKHRNGTQYDVSVINALTGDIYLTGLEILSNSQVVFKPNSRLVYIIPDYVYEYPSTINYYRYFEWAGKEFKPLGMYEEKDGKFTKVSAKATLHDTENIITLDGGKMECSLPESEEFYKGKEFKIDATFSGCFESCEGGFFSAQDSKGNKVKMQMYSSKIGELFDKGVEINKVRLEGVVNGYTDAYTNTANGGKCSLEISGNFTQIN